MNDLLLVSRRKTSLLDTSQVLLSSMRRNGQISTLLFLKLSLREDLIEAGTVYSTQHTQNSRCNTQVDCNLQPLFITGTI